MTEQRWIPVEEAARHLGVARETVYRWIDAKGLPAHRVGRLWKFQTAEVDGWVRSGGAGPGAHGMSMAAEAAPINAPTEVEPITDPRLQTLVD
jgi:excisionase family DNA binding protein